MVAELFSEYKNAVIYIYIYIYIYIMELRIYIVMNFYKEHFVNLNI